MNKKKSGAKKSRGKELKPSDASVDAKSSAESSNSQDLDQSQPPETLWRTVPRVQLSRYVSFFLLLGVVALFSFLFYEVMASFLIPLFLAAILVVVFRPLHRWILEKVQGREKVGALLTTAAILLVVLIPLSVVLMMAALEAREFASGFNTTKLFRGVDKIRGNLGLQMPGASQIRRIDAEIKDVRNTDDLTEFAIDRHRTALFDIEDSAEVLANDIGLAWPENVESETENPDSDNESDTAAGGAGETPPDGAADETEETNDNLDDWLAFVESVRKARTLHFQVTMSRGDLSEESDRERAQKISEYRKTVNEMAIHFGNFKTKLLGGRIKSYLTELANPSEVDSEKYARTLITYLRETILKIGGNAASGVIGVLIGFAIMVIGLYFFLLDGPRMIQSLQGLSPMEDEHEQELVTEFGKVSRAVVIATLLSAVVQGFLAGFGFYFCGLESVFLLSVLTGVLAMVPFVGAAAVWVPCCLYLYFAESQIGAAIGLFFYGTLVISMADNVIKPLVLHGQSNLHPLLALLSVLGGVAALGPIGILIGPMVVAFLQTLLKILQREITEIDQQENAASTEAG